ncbi:hypothetical protein AC1031_011678 [Aphanomyces cochlioides]|nr:hypothetical protein AC1031_011678 [Aphanomyces cochlioides]
MRIDRSEEDAPTFATTNLRSTNDDENDDDDEPYDPNSLYSLLERVLQKVSQLPGALDALSSDPQLLHDLQQHELLFYPIRHIQDVELKQAEQGSSASEVDDDLDDSVDLTSERFGSEYEAELLAVELLQRTTNNIEIPPKCHVDNFHQRTLAETTTVTADAASPSYSMGMLSMSPGTCSQDGDPVSAVWPRRPNEFAFSQPDEGKEDELYNEVLFSERGDDEDDDDDSDEKLFEMEDMEHENRNAMDDFQEDDEVEYETMRLRIIRERNRTGFEPSQEFQPDGGVLIGGIYQIEMRIGEAVFSQTYKAIDTRNGSPVCLKVIRNSKEYFDQAIDEIRILEYLNAAGDLDEHNILRLVDYFYFKEHLILVTELLKDNLYEFSKLVRSHQTQSISGHYFTIPRLKKIAIECLEALKFLHELNIVHCDLKPENIVMKNVRKCEIKVIDFGSASFVSDELTYYIQSRAYRAPEVILGLRYDESIDLWSLGCILAELYSGQVLFSSDSIPTLLALISSVLGNIPPVMLIASPEAENRSTKNIFMARLELRRCQLY